MRALTAVIAISGVCSVIATGTRHRRTGTTEGCIGSGSVIGRSSAGMSTSGATGHGKPVPHPPFVLPPPGNNAPPTYYVPPTFSGQPGVSMGFGFRQSTYQQIEQLVSATGVVRR